MDHAHLSAEGLGCRATPFIKRPAGSGLKLLSVAPVGYSSRGWGEMTWNRVEWCEVRWGKVR